MLLALAMILMQAPAIPPPAAPVVSMNSKAVSAAAAPEAKPEVKSEKKADTKSDAKDGEKKSADHKETSAPVTFVDTLFPEGTSGSYVPGQTVVTPVADSGNGGAITDDAGWLSSSISSSLNSGTGQPAILAGIVRKQPEAGGIGVRKMWFVLGGLEHGAATFDAWSTRRNIMEGTMHEADPMLRPFANSNAMYAAVQVAPVLFDLLSRHMVHSSHSWERRSWWVPQTVSTVGSILSGAHNVAIH